MWFPDLFLQGLLGPRLSVHTVWLEGGNCLPSRSLQGPGCQSMTKGAGEAAVKERSRILGLSWPSSS